MATDLAAIDPFKASGSSLDAYDPFKSSAPPPALTRSGVGAFVDKQLPTDPNAPGYASGAGYLLDNPLTRSFGGVANRIAQGAAHLVGATDAEAALRDRASSFNSPSDASTAEKITHTVGGVGAAAPAFVLGGLPGAIGFGASQGAADVSDREGAGEETSGLQKAGIYGANLLTSVLPANLGGGLTRRIVAGAGIGAGGAVLNNAVQGRDLDAGVVPGALLGAAFGGLHRGDLPKAETPPPSPEVRQIGYEPDFVANANGRTVANKGDRNLGQPVGGAFEEQAPAPKPQPIKIYNDDPGAVVPNEDKINPLNGTRVDADDLRRAGLSEEQIAGMSGQQAHEFAADYNKSLAQGKPFPTAQPGSLADAANAIAANAHTAPAEHVPTKAVDQQGNFVDNKPEPPQEEETNGQSAGTASGDGAEPPAETPAQPQAPAGTDGDSGAAAAIDPDTAHRTAFDARLNQLAQEQQLTPAHVDAIQRNLFQDLPRDRVSGFHGASQLDPAMQRAQEFTRATGKPAVYVEADATNQNGLNAHVGTHVADTHLREVSNAMSEYLKDAAGKDVTVTPFRKGGDEYGYIVTGATPRQAHDAAVAARSDIADYVNRHGLSKIPRKEGTEPVGFGVHFGVSEITPDANPSDIFSAADRQVEARKKGLADYEFRDTTGKTGAEPSGEQPGSAEQGAAATTGERPTGAESGNQPAAAEPADAGRVGPNDTSRPDLAGADRGGDAVAGQSPAAESGRGADVGSADAVARENEPAPGKATAGEAGGGRVAGGHSDQSAAPVGGGEGRESSSVPHAEQAAQELNPRDNPEAFGLPPKPGSLIKGKPRNYVPNSRDFNEHHHDLLDFAALHGGLDPDAWRSAGVDPAQIRPGKDSRGSMRFPRAPLWKRGGLTPDALREMMVERGFLHPDSEHGEAASEANDAIDKVMGSLNQGEKHYTFAGQETQAAIDHAERMQQEHAEAQHLAKERGFDSVEAMHAADNHNFVRSDYDGSPREDIPFSKGKTGGISKAALSAAVSKTVAGFKGDAPKVEIHQSHADAPDSLKKSAGFDHSVEGAYDPKTGTVHLFADAIKTPKRALEVLTHEVVGHHGVEGVLGKEFPKLVSDIAAMRENGSKAMRDIFKEVESRYPDASPETFASEAMAVMSEKGINNSVMDRVLAAVRKFVRGLGIDLKFSDHELRQMLVAADRRVKVGSPTSRAGAAEFSKRAGAASEDMFGGGEKPKEDRAATPRPSTGDLFGGASSRDHVDAAVRAKDDKLSGKGAAPTMRQGDGELFAGDRPQQAKIEDSPKQTKPVTPQVASSDKLKSFIGVAADSVGALRKSDVERVISETPAHYRQSVATHIEQSRPDLATEVKDVMSELSPVRFSKRDDDKPSVAYAGDRFVQRDRLAQRKFDKPYAELSADDKADVDSLFQTTSAAKNPMFSKADAADKEKQPSFLDRVTGLLKPSGADQAASALKDVALKGRELARNVSRAAWAQRDRATGQADAAIDAFRTHFDKRAADVRSDPAKSYADVIAYQQQKPIADPVAKKFIDTMAGMLDKQAQTIRSFGEDKLGLLDQYFPQLWKDPGRAEKLYADMQAKRPLAGAKGFTKERVFADYEQGIKAGMKPAFDNPADALMARYQSGERYLAALRIKDGIDKLGLLKDIGQGDRVPQGFARVNDNTFSGKVVPEMVAKDLNNYLAPGLSQFKAWQNFRWLQNVLLSSRLGFSAFHAGFTTVDSAMTHLDLGMRKALSGDIAGALKHIGQVPLTPLHALQGMFNRGEGAKLVRQFYGQEHADPQTSAVLDALTQGGARGRMDPTDYNNDFAQTLRAWRTDGAAGLAKTPARTIGAVLEGVMRPIAHNLVPAQKMTARVELMKYELDRLARQLGEKKGDYAAITKAMNQDSLRQVAHSVVQRVDDRLGQLAYDNLFWNRTVKDILQASIQSVGWNVGTKNVIFGGLADVQKIFKPESLLAPLDKNGKITDAQMSRITGRLSYLVALNVGIGALGAVTQYMLTGEGPQELKDYFFPKTGNKNPDGTDARISFPSYVKDEFGFARHPIETVEHKLHPSFSMVAELLNNKDFYGNEVYDPDAPWSKVATEIAGHVVKGFVPYAVQNQQNIAQAGGSLAARVAPFVGVTPAPGDISHSDAQNYISQSYYSAHPSESKTPEQADHSHAFTQAVNAIRQGQQADLSQFTPAERAKINKYAKEDPAKLVEKHFAALPLEQQVVAYQKASDAERKQYRMRAAILKGYSKGLEKISDPETKAQIKSRVDWVRSGQ